jgi:hypothetical protein
VVLREPFKEEAHYFGQIKSRFDGGTRINDIVRGNESVNIGKSSISARQIPDGHDLIKRGRADKGDTLITIDIPQEIGGLWDSAKLHVYSCEPPSTSPKSVSVLASRVSSTAIKME